MVAWVQEPLAPIFLASSGESDAAALGSAPGALHAARLEGGRWGSLGDEVRARSGARGVGPVSLTLDAQGTPWMA